MGDLVKTARRTRPFRTTGLVAVAAAAALSLTACQGDGGKDDAGSSSSSSAAASSKGSGADGSAPAGSGAKAPETKDSGRNGSGPTGGKSGDGGSKSGDNGSGSVARGSGGGDKDGYGQVCGANDLSWTATSKTQAGGYTLLSVKAKPGITCTLPGHHPVVAFGSDGTEAGPAEQALTEQVKLSGGTVAYAGVNPKTTDNDYGKELDSIIVKVSGDDQADPVSLSTGSMTVDRPVVTNWHTSLQEAVPGDLGTS
ncbi:DUF4232 domain-containing protein [Streptomyces sp. bgisy100]|uniref:DUF4232 domain-containing protein n=1 Tax=Streptomyces sp. bgisy100 TaxID=3413783 RepID=UPI003D73134F